MPKKLGQYFLKNTAAHKKIAAALAVQTGETVIEIGPGHGELTNKLLAFGFRVSGKDGLAIKIIAIEKDGYLAEKLKRKFADDKNVEIVEGDVLKILPDVVKNYKLKPKSYKLAGNIPYYITGHLLRTIGNLEPKPERCVFTLQKEVAERLAAKPPKMNRLAAAVQFWADPEIILALPKTEFRPRPKVNSAVILLKTKRQKPAVPPSSYYKMMKIIFHQPRKTTLNNLVASGLSREIAAEALRRAGLSPNLRPQNLKTEDIARIAATWG